MRAALGEAALEDVALVAHPLGGAPQGELKRGEVRATDVAQLTALQIRPDPLDGIESGRVAGEVLQLDPLGRATGQEVLAGLAAVTGRPLPDEEELARDLAPEHAQETDHRGAVGGS